MKKKLIFFITIFLLIGITGCGKYNEKDILRDLNKKVNKSNSYMLNGVLEITNNDDTFQYDVEVNYKKSNKYRVSLINKANNHEQIILKNDEGVYVITPSLNKSFKFQSDWPNNNSQIYLLKSLIEDIENDDNMIFKKEKDKYIFTTKVNYPNNSELVKQKITLNKDLTFDKVEVLNSNDASQMIMSFYKIEYNCNIDDKIFDLDNIIDDIEVKDNKNNSEIKEDVEQKNSDENSSSEQNENETKEESKEQTENKESNTTSTIDDIIYPLYIPTGTVLSNQEKISKTDGERIILTFEGEKPFLLVEETSTVSNEFDIIPTFGEPYQLSDTIGALTDSSITWSSNGIDYYIVSDTMSQIELIEIASSITAIPTIK